MSETAPTETGFFTEEMTISVGPQHPRTHGVLRFVVKTDGEVISEAIPDVGYLHRSIEKIGEKVTYHGYVPYTDRADYLAAMFANQAFCLAAEKLAGTEVTRRGRVLPGDRLRAQPSRQPFDLGRHFRPGHRRHDTVRPRAARAGVRSTI